MVECSLAVRPVTNGDAMSAVQGGLGLNGTLVVIGAAQAMQVSPLVIAGTALEIPFPADNARIAAGRAGALWAVDRARHPGGGGERLHSSFCVLLPLILV